MKRNAGRPEPWLLAVLAAVAAPDVGRAQAIQGTNKTGLLPIHIYTLRIPPGSCHPNPAFPECLATGDTLPPGGGNKIYYTFGLFDTGSTVVRISTEAGPLVMIDDELLQLCSPSRGCSASDGYLPPSLDLRVWGLDAVVPGQGAPLDVPEAEVKSLKVRPQGNLTLIGAPVVNSIVAYIDHTTPVARTYDWGTYQSMDMTFYPAGGVPAGRAPLYEVNLTPFGDTGTSPIDGATLGQRYYVRDLALENRTQVAGGAEFDFILDTGTTSTMISTEVAAALGIDAPAAPDDVLCLGGTGAACTGGESLKGYVIDRFVLTARDGSYQYVINDPLVFVRPPNPPTAPPRNAFGGAADGIIGVNYLDKTRILVNGPARTMGFYVGVRVTSKSFIRGDVNDDGSINIADPVTLLSHLFGGTAAPRCLDAADGNNDGSLNIGDPVAILNHLFGGSGPLPAPFPGCGVDSGAGDTLGCAAFNHCP